MTTNCKGYKKYVYTVYTDDLKTEIKERKYFGNYNEAIEATGLNHDTLYSLLSQNPKKQHIINKYPHITYERNNEYNREAESKDKRRQNYKRWMQRHNIKSNKRPEKPPEYFTMSVYQKKKYNEKLRFEEELQRRLNEKLSESSGTESDSSSLYTSSGSSSSTSTDSE